jgi:hypothetical protein
MSTKRKSDTSTSASKKARTSAHTSAQALVTAILANTNAYPISGDDSETRNTLVQLAQYTRSLEEEVAVGGSSKPAPKTQEQLEEAAEKIEKAARSGIRKQMTVCHQNSLVDA